MLILTGFEPFAHFKENPSWEVVNALQSDYVMAIKMPVSYEKVKKLTKEVLEKYQPEAIISFGLADGRAQISIEMLAVNMMDSTTPDNDGFKPKRLKIFEDGKATYITTLPIFEILDEWHKNYIPSYISYHAGTYVCNALFYSFLYHAEKMGLDIPIGFIHLPSSEKMVIGKKNRPYVEIKTMEKAAKIAIEITSRHLSSP